MPKTPKEDQKREDEVLRRMLNTPPQKHEPLRKKRGGLGRLARDEIKNPSSGT